MSGLDTEAMTEILGPLYAWEGYASQLRESGRDGRHVNRERAAFCEKLGHQPFDGTAGDR